MEEYMRATQTKTEPEARNERVWFVVCPKGHLPLFDNRPKEVDICTLCKVPEKLTDIGEGFVSHKERNQGFAESYPEPTAQDPILPDRL
jgi:hypothetical protein